MFSPSVWQNLQVALLVTMAPPKTVLVSRAELVSREKHMAQLQKRRASEKKFTVRPWSAATQAFMENCTYWQDLPNYSKRWRKRKFIRDSFRTLHDKYGLRCMRKPDGPTRSLGTLSPAAINAKIAEAGEAIWQEDSWRQQKYRVHAETESIHFLWRQQLLDETSYKTHWDEWRPLFEPAIRAVCEAYGYEYEDADVWKVMIARLRPGQSVKPHEDMAPALVYAHRVHWVLSGELGVKTLIGGDDVPLTDGDLFEFNNIRLHSVSNEGQEPRVHAIFDLVPKKVPPGPWTVYEPDPSHYDYSDGLDSQPVRDEI